MKKLNYLIIIITFFLLSCILKKEEPLVSLHTIIDGLVRDSVNNIPIKDYEIILYKNMLYEPDGNKDLYTCLSDTNGYYKFDVYLLPGTDYNYKIGSTYNAIYYVSTRPTSYYNIVPGQNKTINIYLIKGWH